MRELEINNLDNFRLFLVMFRKIKADLCQDLSLNTCFLLLSLLEEKCR